MEGTGKTDTYNPKETPQDMTIFGNSCGILVEV